MIFGDVLSNFAIPAGGAGVVTLLIVVAYRLIVDRSAVRAEITGLSDQVTELTSKVRKLETLYDEQRGLKHRAFNDLARTTMALVLVRKLATECACNVLGPLPEIIDGVLNEMETSHRTSPIPRSTP